MTQELIDEEVSSFISQNKLISEDLRNDLVSNFQPTDGSNACVYLCTKIADELLKFEDVSDKKSFLHPKGSRGNHSITAKTCETFGEC